MPGGKIVVYTGLIKTLNLNDDELASIVGHEISHALKEHSREKMSKVMVQDTVSSILSLLGISKTVTDTANLAYNAAFAMPFSRDQESEADKYGLELMYKAGFDPNACVTVMQKMDAYEKQASAEAGVSKSETPLRAPGTGLGPGPHSHTQSGVWSLAALPPPTEEPGGPQSMGSLRVRHD